MREHAEPGASVAEQYRDRPAPGAVFLRRVDPAARTSAEGPSVSTIRIVGVGDGRPLREWTLADLLEIDPAAGQSLAVYELVVCR